MNQKKVTEYEELSIETVMGLQAFLRNAQAQYQIGLGREADFLAQGNQTYGDDLQHAFQTIRHTTNKLISNVQQGKKVSQDDATKLQSDYDELVRVVSSGNTKPVVDEKPKIKPRPEPAPRPEIKKKKVESVKATAQPDQKERIVDKPKPAVKPKTGSLTINSEDPAVLDVKNKMKVAGSAQVQQNRFKAEKVKKHDTAKLKLVITKSQSRYEKLKKQYKNPNLAQDLLFEEAREGIEHLELMSKKPAFKKEQMLSVSEVATHVKYALDGIVEADENARSKAKKQTVPVVTKQVTKSRPVSFVPTSVTTQKAGVAKRTIPKRLQTLPKPEEEFGQESLTKLYLTSHRHLQFLQENYSSPAGFEQILDATITRIEADTIDSIEKWLGDIPASAFSFLKDMKIDEIESFANRPFEQVTHDLQKQNIKYETFVAWRDTVGEMLEVVPNGDSMLFGELFANWMFELAAQHE